MKKKELKKIWSDLVRFGRSPKLDKKDYKKKLELKLELIWSALV